MMTIQTTIYILIIYEKLHCGDLVVKFNGNHVKLAFNTKIYARMVLQNVTIKQELLYKQFAVESCTLLSVIEYTRFYECECLMQQFMHGCFYE